MSMKYLLVDKYDNIVTSVDLASNVGMTGARTYFIGTKKIDEEEFDKLWKVMTETDYKTQFTSSLRDHKQYEWWRDEPTKPDEGFDY